MNDDRTPLQDKERAVLFIARPTVFYQQISMSLVRLGTCSVALVNFASIRD